MAQYSSLGQLDMSSSEPKGLADSKGSATEYQRQTFDSASSRGDGHSSHRPTYYEAKEWIWELLAWLAGTCVIAATVTLLAVFNQKPVNDWRFNVQLSTVIAVLTQVTQSMLLVPTSSCIGQLKWTWFRDPRHIMDLERFDGASRGPWGSIILLFTLSLRPRIVHLGALATAFMVVFPTFFQQSLKTHLRKSEDPNAPVSIYIAKTYEPLKVSVVYDPDDFSFSSSEYDQFMTSAITTSMFTTSQTAPRAPAECPSGSCTFDYTTLALCHTTTDVTSQLHPNWTVPTSLTMHIPGINVSSSSYNFWTSATYSNGESLPERSYGMPMFINKTKTGAATLLGKNFGNNTTPLTLNNTNTNINDLAHIYLAYQDVCLWSNKTGSGERVNPKSWRAYKATLGLCLKTLSTRVDATTSNTTEREVHTKLRWTKIEEPNPINPNETIPTWSTSLKNSSSDNSGDDEAYTMTLATAEQLGRQIARMFDMQASYIVGGDNYVYGNMLTPTFVSEIMGPEPLQCPSGENATTADGVRYGHDSFNNRIDRIALGVTNAFRTATSSRSQQSGTSFRSTQYFDVDFRLLAAPLALFTLITAFFLVTVLRTLRVPLWKSSQLAVLYAMGVPSRLGTKAGMEAVAAKEGMRFDEGWGLKGAAVG